MKRILKVPLFLSASGSIAPTYNNEMIKKDASRETKIIS